MIELRVYGVSGKGIAHFETSLKTPKRMCYTYF